MNVARPLALLVLLATSPLAFATAYKCTVDGRTTYQDKPCAGGGKSEELDLPGSFAPALSGLAAQAGGGTTAVAPNGTLPGGYTMQELAFGLAVQRTMVQRCPLSTSVSSQLDKLAGVLGPYLLPLGNAGLEAAAADARRKLEPVLNSAARASACQFAQTSITDAYNKLQAARAGAGPGTGNGARARPTPTL